MLLKAISRVFHPRDKPVLSFSIRAVSSKRFNELSQEDKEASLEFIQECQDSLQRFKDGLLKTPQQ